MKTLFIITLLFLGSNCIGQKKNVCGAGYSWMPTLETTSLIIKADTCLPDSVCKKLFIEFYKNLCGETGFASMNVPMNDNDTGFFYDSGNTWVNDSVGCVEKERWGMRIKGKWIPISKCLYHWYNGNKCNSYTLNEGNKEEPCCGHFHKTKPE